MAQQRRSALEPRRTRRGFLGTVVASGLGGALLSACGNGSAPTSTGNSTAASSGAASIAVASSGAASRAASSIVATGSVSARAGAAAVVSASAIMVLKYKAVPPQPPQLGFTSGHEAMFYNGDWAIGNSLRQIGSGFEMGTMAFPGQTADKAGVCWSGGEHVQAFRGKNQDDAAQFLLWLTSPANIESINTQTGYIPTRQSVISGKSYQGWLAQNPLYKVYADSMPKTQPRVPTNLFTQLTNAISLELEKPIKQTATVKDALAAAVQDCLAIMQQAGYQP